MRRWGAGCLVLMAIWPATAVAQQPAVLATPAVEIATVTGELLGQAEACRTAKPRLDKLEERILAALGRAAENRSDYDYALTRYQEEKTGGVQRQRRNQTGMNCDLVRRSFAELERRKF